MKAKVQAGGTKQKRLMENKEQKHTGSYVIPERGWEVFQSVHSASILETSELLLAACAQE